MAFPWIFSDGFELGATPAGWDSEEDTGSLLDFPHYTELARYGMAPYHGSYCMRIKMGDTNDHTVTEGDLNIIDTGTAFARWYMYLGKDVTASADDDFNIYEFQQAGGTPEASVGLRITAATDVIEIGIGDGTAPTNYSPVPLERGRWYCIEAKMLVSTGGAGTLDLFVDDTARVSLTTLTNAAAVGSGSLGTQDTLSTTTGTILFDDFIFDDTQIFRDKVRFSGSNVWQYNANDHPVVGHGRFSVAVTGTSGDAILSLYDSDGVPDNLTPFAVISSSASPEFVPGHDIFEVHHGCYAVMSGTAAQAFYSVMRGGVISQGHYVTLGHAQKSPKP